MKEQLYRDFMMEKINGYLKVLNVLWAIVFCIWIIHLTQALTDPPRVSPTVSNRHILIFLILASTCNWYRILLAGQQSGHCAVNQFRCATNKFCINNMYRCDGFNDCGDGSDEEGCIQSPCHFGACSQICVEKKGGNFSCHCAPGFIGEGTSRNRTCLARGNF